MIKETMQKDTNNLSPIGGIKPDETVFLGSMRKTDDSLSLIQDHRLAKIHGQYRYDTPKGQDTMFSHPLKEFEIYSKLY